MKVGEATGVQPKQHLGALFLGTFMAPRHGRLPEHHRVPGAARNEPRFVLFTMILFSRCFLKAIGKLPWG